MGICGELSIRRNASRLEAAMAWSWDACGSSAAKPASWRRVPRPFRADAWVEYPAISPFWSRTGRVDSREMWVGSRVMVLTCSRGVEAADCLGWGRSGLISESGSCVGVGGHERSCRGGFALRARVWCAFAVGLQNGIHRLADGVRYVVVDHEDCCQAVAKCARCW